MGKLLLTLLFAATPLVADQITFSFVSLVGNTATVKADPSGFQAGPAVNTTVTDSTTSMIVPLAGVVNASTGAASSFSVLPNVVLAVFNAGSGGSVSIVNPITTAPILTGSTNDNSTLVATHPGGTGAFLGGFDVTFVDPALLAEFGLHDPDPRGSLGITFGQDTLLGKTLSAVGGGGTITITATPISEPASSGLLLLGLAGGAFFAGRQRWAT